MNHKARALPLLIVLASLAAAGPAPAALSNACMADPTTGVVVGDLVTEPQWAATPSSSRVLALYPRRGDGHEGKTSMICEIGTDGRLANCVVAREAPDGRGFGDSAVELSQYFRMRLTDKDGKSVAGRCIWIPVRWDPP